MEQNSVHITTEENIIVVIEPSGGSITIVNNSDSSHVTSQNQASQGTAGNPQRPVSGIPLLIRNPGTKALQKTNLAGEEGFEPSLPDPESGVLPLDDSPVRINYSQQSMVCQRHLNP